MLTSDRSFAAHLLQVANISGCPYLPRGPKSASLAILPVRRGRFITHGNNKLSLEREVERQRLTALLGWLTSLAWIATVATGSIFVGTIIQGLIILNYPATSRTSITEPSYVGR